MTMDDVLVRENIPMLVLLYLFYCPACNTPNAFLILTHTGATRYLACGY
jgi:hypothetical protein